MRTGFQFIESIRLHDGRFDLIHLHEARMHRSLKTLGMKADSFFRLEDYLRQFQVPVTGLYKCRLLYGPNFSVPEFLPYQKKTIRFLSLVDGSGIKYDLKYSCRQDIDRLFQARGRADDILIVVDGQITDTSFCNIAFRKGKEWLTPEKPLLAGVRRESLLQAGFLQTRPVEPGSIREFDVLKLFNALISWEEADEIPVQNILNI